MAGGEEAERLEEEVRALRAEAEALRARNAALEAMLEVINDAVYLKDPAGQYRIINTAGARLLGRSVEEVIGKDDTEVFAPDTAGRIRALDREVLADGKARTFEEEATAAGVTRTYLVTKGPYRDERGGVAGLIGISRDITARRRAEMELRETRELLERLLDHAPAPVFVDGRDGRVRLVNRAWETMLGRPREEVVGHHIAEFFPPEDVTRFLDENRRVIELAGPLELDEPIAVAGGRRDFHTVKFPLYDGAGEIDAVGGISFDITERRRAELELREREEQVRLLLDSTGEAIYGVDLEGRCTLCNAAALRLLGYAEASDLIGKEMHRLVHHTRSDGSPFPPEECRIYRAFRQGEGAHVEDEVLWRADGTSFPVEYWSYPVRRDGTVVGAVVTFVDITGRKRVEEAMRRSAERLLELSRRVVEVQEQERRRLARELHDEIGQTLTAIGLGLQNARRSCGDHPPPQIDECIAIVDRVIRQVRHLSLDLRPSMLDDLGLVAALRWYVDRQARRVGYQGRFAAQPGEIRLEPAVATAAFRVAQEALTNVARHARAGRVRVALRLRAGSLRLVVADDGVGFDPTEAVKRTAVGEGLGLLGMRERATLLGGRVAIRSTPGRGAVVRLKVPLGRPGEGA